jgi:hypothetical protein
MAFLVNLRDYGIRNNAHLGREVCLEKNLYSCNKSVKSKCFISVIVHLTEDWYGNDYMEISCIEKIVLKRMFDVKSEDEIPKNLSNLSITKIGTNNAVYHCIHNRTIKNSDFLYDFLETNMDELEKMVDEELKYEYGEHLISLAESRNDY